MERVDRATINAQNKLREAQAALETVKSAPYCCDHSRNQALGKAKKQVKRWESWLADRKVLESGQERPQDYSYTDAA